ncbi:MAG: ABC transporter ATP-binding protein [Povalibacter sp.]
MSTGVHGDSALLSCRELNVTIADRLLVRELSFTLRRGSITCILGRNGAGKTLTLHTLCGLREASGEIRFQDRLLAEWPHKELAQRLGLLTQITEDPFPSTVLETALIGRHPHIGFWQWESDEDRNVASSALQAVEMNSFAERDVSTLSGGERRRVAIATLLAQDPQLLVLDEPINHLDPHHQLSTLNLLRQKANDGRGVLMTLHDAGLAARFCDEAILLFGDGEWLSGPIDEVLTPVAISRLYGVNVREVRWQGGRTFVAE